MVREIEMRQGLVALVDDEDYARVSQFRWWPERMKDTDGIYVITRLERGGSRVWLHRFVMEVTDRSVFVDHINRNPLDNRRCNLRLATVQQNNFNRKYNRLSASGFRGVTWNKKCQRWQAGIKIAGKSIHLGLFSNSQEAAHIYDQKARELFGEFARLNFPHLNEEAA